MRHNKKFNHLSRKKGHRDALLANMTISLILHKRLFTTLAKAKALRMYDEPIINRAKIADRPGGYTRILKVGNRYGDNAQTCFIELVDYNEAMLAAKDDSAKKKTTRRSRRSTKKAEAPVAAAPAAEAPAAEEAKAE